MNAPEGHEADFALHSPPERLRPYIAHYAGFRAYGIPPNKHSGLPSRHVGLVISLAKPIEIVRMPCAPGARSFQSFVSGFQMGPTTVAYGTSRDGLFIHLTPPGVEAVLGVTSIEVASQIIDFREVWGAAADHLIERLLGTPTWRKRFGLLDEVFLKALYPIMPPRELTWAWRRLTQTHGCLPVRALADEIGWSRQHLRERFHRAFGMPPKTAARIFRFERACRLISARRWRLADVAAACGYHDQAHMTLEWGVFAGRTPRAWIADEFPFFQYSQPPNGDDLFDSGSSDLQKSSRDILRSGG